MGAARKTLANSQNRGASSSYRRPKKPTERQMQTPKHGRTSKKPINLTDDNPSAPSSSMPTKKRAARASYPTGHSGTGSQSAKKRKTDTSSEPQEKRVRVFRANPPKSFQDVYDRALSQRFYVLGRQRCGTDDCPEESVEMTGSTGNIYNVHICKNPSCTCPHSAKGHQCKHILYVMKRVLNAPFELVYQLGLLSSELREIIGKAPPIVSPVEAEKDAESNKRKPIEGDCPICFCEFESDSPESIVWCRAACGQNMHQECFKMWAATKGSNVTCPFCRSTWEGDESAVSKVQKEKGVYDEGYVNIADQLGVSRVRDESTYSPWFGYSGGNRHHG